MSIWRQISYSLGLFSGTSDEDLMSLVKTESSESAFRALFERHHKAVFNRLMRMGCSQTVAEEIVQDVFMNVFRARESYKEGLAFRPWITVMARNRLIDLYRSKEFQYVQNIDEIEVPSEDSIEEIYWKKEQIHSLELFLTQLKMTERELIALWLDDFSYEEISNIVGKSVSAVKFSLHQAKKNLVQLAQGEV